MAVLEIQANGDTAVSKEAIVNAGQSLEDPLMRVSLCKYVELKSGICSIMLWMFLYNVTHHAWLCWTPCFSSFSAGVHAVVFTARPQVPSYSSRPAVPQSPVRSPLPQTARRPLPHQQPVWVSHLHTPSELPRLPQKKKITHLLL